MWVAVLAPSLRVGFVVNVGCWGGVAALETVSWAELAAAPPWAPGLGGTGLGA